MHVVTINFCVLVAPYLGSNGVEFYLDFLFRLIEELGNL